MKSIASAKSARSIAGLKSSRRELFERVRHLVPDLEDDDDDDDNLYSPPVSAARRPDLHWEVIQRILFIYARLNPVVGYVQGMNCLLAPMYWLFANDNDPVNQANAEADAFYCLSALMADTRDHFLDSMDGDNATGIHASLTRLEERLHIYDPVLCTNLQQKQLAPHYYAFRWYTCLCVLEWPLPEVLRIWDSILADYKQGHGGGVGGKMSFLVDFCCAMLICVRTELLSGNFEDNVQLLQDYPIHDLSVVFIKAYELKRSRQIPPVTAVAIAFPRPGWGLSAIKHLARAHSRLMMRG